MQAVGRLLNRVLQVANSGHGVYRIACLFVRVNGAIMARFLTTWRDCGAIMARLWRDFLRCGAIRSTRGAIAARHGRKGFQNHSKYFDLACIGRSP